MKKLIIILLIPFCSIDCISQITFEKTYGGSNHEQGFELIQLIDSSFVVAGSTRSFGEPNGDFYLIKTDKNGNLQWQQTYGGLDSDFCYSIEKAFDGGYILAGTTSSFGSGSLDYLIIKVDSVGTFEWKKYYGGIGVEKLKDVIHSFDFCYYFLGITYSFGAGTHDIQILKTDVNGDTLWTKTYGGIHNDVANCLIQSTDSNLLFVGWTSNFNANSGDVLLTKIDTSGNIIWTKTYGGLYFDGGSHLIQTFDGGYMITGRTQSSTAGVSNKLYLIKTDSFGDTIWTKAYNNHYFVNSNCIEQTVDGGYIITGSENITGTNPDVYVFKIDANGNEEWSASFGGASLDYGLCIKQTFDEGFVVSGTNSSIGAGGEDVYLKKFNRAGLATGFYPKEHIRYVNIFPNPTTGIVTINAERLERIEIVNIEGRKVYTGIESEIDLSSQPNGIYIINVIADKQSFSSKLIKQ